MCESTLSWRDIERMAAVHLAIVMTGLGVAIVAVGPTFEIPKGVLSHVTGGQVWPYGIMFIASGLVLSGWHPRAMFIGHIAGIVAYNLFAAVFLALFLRGEGLAILWWWGFFSLGTVHGFNLALMWVRRHRSFLERPGGGVGEVH